MEFLQVFDENKNMLNEKIERELKKTLTGNKYFMIIKLFIENDKGEFLLQKTAASRNSEIATTGGHVTYGDDGFKTVIKEAKEELGIELESDDVQYVDTVTMGNCHIDVYYTNKEINNNDIKLQEEEVESVEWYATDYINKLIENNQLRKSDIEPFNRVLSYKKEYMKNR